MCEHAESPNRGVATENGLPMFRRRQACVRALADMLSMLPPELSRREAAGLIPGLVTVQGLRSLDARGLGPPRKIYTAEGCLYPTAIFLEWLEDRYL